MGRIRALRDLEPGERVLRVDRRHPLHLLRSALPALMLLIALPLPFAVLRAAADTVLTLVCTGGLLALALGWLAWAWADWRADWLVLTDRRILWIERSPWVRERRWEAPLSSVQNVAAVSGEGLVARLAGCADLVLDTSSRGVQRLHAIHHARGAAASILDAQRYSARRVDRLLRLRAGMGIVDEETLPEPEAPGVRVWRRHPWLLIRRALRPAGIFVVGVLLTAALNDLLPFALTATLASVWAAWLWDDWRNDEVVVTADRILQTRRSPLRLHDESWQASLEKVQDVGYEIPNPLAQLLDYGTVTVKTGGEDGEFVLGDVPHPREVSAEINRRLQLLRGRRDRKLLRAVEESVRSVLHAHGL
ncbi:MAG: PH domain-containing protein [Chloroflexota bacterium]|nr:PH domain-containing protein [Chloroflexota bacterium]